MKFLGIVLLFASFPAFAEDPSRLFIQFTKSSDLFVKSAASPAFNQSFVGFQSMQTGNVWFTGYNAQGVKVYDSKNPSGFSLSLFTSAGGDASLVAAFRECLHLGAALATTGTPRALRVEVVMKPGLTIQVNNIAMSFQPDAAKIATMNCGI